MSGALLVRSFPPPAVDQREILRYAGVSGDAPELEGPLAACLEEIRGKLSYQACWREFPVACRGGGLDLGFMETDSAGLQKNLRGCDSVIVFAATVGLEIDRLIARYGAASPSKALLFQAIGAERIESLCDAFCQEISREKAAAGLYTRPRFSPGYGDFPLEAQKEIFRVLDCPKAIGLYLNESLLMSPSKSVTALIGIGGDDQGKRAGKCAACAKQDCAYRSLE